MAMTGCKLCQIAEMNDRDFYLQWYVKRLSKFNLQHAPNCPNRTQRTLYNLGKRLIQVSKQFE